MSGLDDILHGFTKIDFPGGSGETDNPLVEKAAAIALVIGVVGWVGSIIVKALKPNEEK